MGVLGTVRKCRIIRYAINKLLEKKYNLQIGSGTHINSNCKFEGYNRIGANCTLTNSELGYLSYVANEVNLYATKVGRYCAIGPRVRTTAGNHPTEGFVSIHPTFYSTQKFAGTNFSHKQRFEEFSFTDPDEQWVVEIGNDVWIGDNVTILNGCKIGDGAIIAAGAMVVKDVPPYTIVGGVPAKAIRTRFTEEQREFLLQFKWWEKDIKWLETNVDHFEDIERFMKKWKTS